MPLSSAWRRATVYAVVDAHGQRQWRWALKPMVDAAYWRQAGARLLVPLAPPLPAMWADLACRTATRLGASSSSDAGGWMGGVRRSLGRLLSFARPEPSRLATSPFLPRWGSVLRLHGVEYDARRISQALRWAGCETTVRPGEPLWIDLADGSFNAAGGTHWASRPPESDLAAVSAALAGRLLSLREVEKLLEREGFRLSRPVAESLAWLALSGQVHQWPGVRRNALGMMQCVRCGATEELRAWECAACGSSACWQCEACRALGLVRSCTVLYAAAVEQHGGHAEEAVGSEGRSRIQICIPELTLAQSRASHALAAFVGEHWRGPTAAVPREPGGVAHGQRTVRDALVWAVCGAGKTELSFAAVAKVLEKGGRVLFAVPRRDVVRQLGRRLRAAFPGVEMQVLHGGADRLTAPVLSPGSLTVATTHQVLRYYRAFDLVVLDEVDAFPYRGSRMLAEAVVRAAAPGGVRIRMTATPDDDLLRQAETGECVLIRVPARYHGHPLPVPELVVDRRLDQPAREHVRQPFRPSPTLLALIERSLQATPPARVLLFVPTVAAAERVGRGMALAMPGRVLWSHARDPDRDAKLEAFLRAEASVLVATSILERGVTVPDVDVIVLYADEERIFQQPALIQMAGRVGRTAQRPTGRVAFVARRITPAMRLAVKHIESMNAEAAALGLLRGYPLQGGGDGSLTGLEGRAIHETIGAGHGCGQGSGRQPKAVGAAAR